MSDFAFIDGKPVPAALTPECTKILYPQGLAGLREETDLASTLILPNADGVVNLELGCHYTLQPVPSDTVQSQLTVNAMHPHSTAHSWENLSEVARPCTNRKLVAAFLAEQSGDEASVPLVYPSLEGGAIFATPITTHGSRSAASAIPHATSMGDAAILSQRNEYMSQIEGDDTSIGHLGDDHQWHSKCHNPTAEHKRDPRDREDEQRRDIEAQPPKIKLEAVRSGKLIQDRVHAHIFLPMLAMDIVDTPEFQRLRGLKQLGTTFFLYPGATHTRFEHSIGVAHMASLVVQHLAQKQPELRITEADILCVTIAGLCHDIGHGPFSHLFEKVLQRINAEKNDPTCELSAGDSLKRPPRGTRLSQLPQQPSENHWSHEDMSIRLLRKILSRTDLTAFGLNSADARFIEYCIKGLKPKESWPAEIGRPEHKRFLLDIVANKRHGIDVDKLDYFLRDSLSVYGRAAADVHFSRLLSASRVLLYEGQYQICYEEKVALSLGDIFTVRAKLHKHVYKHRIVEIIDCMVSDALNAADAYFRVRSADGRLLNISETTVEGEEDAYCLLGDWILQSITASDDKRLEKAQSIIHRITVRDFYSVVGKADIAVSMERGLTKDRVKNDLIDLILATEVKGSCEGLTDEELAAYLHENIIVYFTQITYGSSGDGCSSDPMNEVAFFNPKNMSAGAFKLPANRRSPLFSPSEFSEVSMTMLLREGTLLPTVAKAFEKWKMMNARFLTVAVPSSNVRSTPVAKRQSSVNSTPTKRPRWEDAANLSQSSLQSTNPPPVKLC